MDQRFQSYRSNLGRELNNGLDSEELERFCFNITKAVTYVKFKAYAKFPMQIELQRLNLESRRGNEAIVKINHVK